MQEDPRQYGGRQGRHQRGLIPSLYDYTNNYQEPIPLQLCTYSLSEKMLIRSTADSKTKEKKKSFRPFSLLVTDLNLFNFDVLWDWPGQGPHLAQEPFVPIILSGLCLGKEVEEQNITQTYIPVNIDYLFLLFSCWQISFCRLW